MGQDDHLRQGTIVSETAAHLDRAQMLDELRVNTHRIARWRCDLDVVKANMFDWTLGAFAATAENLYDFVPELFVQSLCDLGTGTNSAVTEMLQQQASLAVPQRILTIEPTGGSDGTAVTPEQALQCLS